MHYLQWLQQCAWAHSAAVGYPPETLLGTGCAMAVREVRMSYLQATFAVERNIDLMASSRRP